jgi:alpha-glucosidase
MQLVPYLYTLFDECHRTGAPILRPLLFSYPDDATTYTVDDQFMLGDALLVAPITRPGVEHRHVYLPAGHWRQFWTDELVEGPAHVLAHAPLGRPAVYARCNTPIPMWPVVQHTSEAPSSLTWKVFPHLDAPPGAASLFEDAGDGYGPCSRRTAHVERGEGGLVRFRLSARRGSFVPPARRVFVDLSGEVVEIEESAEPVVIERFVTNDD